MTSQTVHLPNGQTYTVTPVFQGFFFKFPAHPDHHHRADHAYPAGWTIVLRTGSDDNTNNGPIHFFTQPTLQADRLFISSVSYPSSRDFQPAPSPTRHIAMMLWVTLHWYFHQRPAPSHTLPATTRSQSTPEAGRPRGEWRVLVEPSGILSGHMLARLERMGLVSAPDTAVWRGGERTARIETAGGTNGTRGGVADTVWINDMFISRGMFWQLPARQFLFTLAPASAELDSCPMSPQSPAGISSPELSGPFFSSSHLPTYFPPPPPHFVMTEGVRHPLRPRPPRMGEVFYTRFVPSVGHYLSLRVASASPDPVPYAGPRSSNPDSTCSTSSSTEASRAQHLTTLSDAGLMQAWLGIPRVSASWGTYSPGWLEKALASTNSFPVIGLWDGVPFGYFEIYWVLEDALGRLLACGADPWDRGVHALVGEDWARGRMQAWLTSLVHYAFEADPRTMSVCIEPRVDNERFIRHLQDAGFNKEREVTFPHKQSWFGRLRRDGWQGPAL